MKDPNPLSEQNAAAEDVATLYSWANLHGAKYRDFSAARAQTREKARLRAEQAIEESLKKEQPEASAGEANFERESLAPLEAEGPLATGEPQEAGEARAVEPANEPARMDALEETLEASNPGTSAEQSLSLEVHQEQTPPEATGLEQTDRQEADPEQASPELASSDQLNQQQVDQAPGNREQGYRAESVAEPAVREAELAAQLAAAQQAAEQAAKAEAEQAASRAAQEAAQLAELQAAQRARDHAAYLAEQEAAQRAVQRAAELAVQQGNEPQRRTWQQQPPAGRFGTSPTPKIEQDSFARTAPYRPAAIQFSAPPSGPFSDRTQFSPLRGERARVEAARPSDQESAQETTQGTAQGSGQGSEPDARELALRPGWLAKAPASLSPAVLAPDETQLSSRDRLVPRWFALRGVFEGSTTVPEPLPAPAVSRPPAMAVFSLAGGVGKTSLVATLGRALSARGERVLLVDTAAFGLLPFFFGATDQRPGQLRTFVPPGGSSDAPIQMVTIDPDGLSADQTSQESLSGEISKFSRGAGRVLIDLATASGASTRRIMGMAPVVLVPVIADMNSVVSVNSIDSFFEHNNTGGERALPYYVLNQFDASLPLHLDVREVLREQLGERLLPFALRRAPAMSEALAEGMTVLDYAPGSTLAEDFNTLAGWVKSLSAPATTSYRGVRWSER